MNWKEYDKDEWFGELFKEGTILRLEYDSYPTFEKVIRYIMVGEVNTSKGTNDEFVQEDITHYTEDFIPKAEEILKDAKYSFENR